MVSRIKRKGENEISEKCAKIDLCVTADEEISSLYGVRYRICCMPYRPKRIHTKVKILRKISDFCVTQYLEVWVGLMSLRSSAVGPKKGLVQWKQNILHGLREFLTFAHCTFS